MEAKARGGGVLVLAAGGRWLVCLQHASMRHQTQGSSRLGAILETQMLDRR
jgi:hypothetical protein